MTAPASEPTVAFKTAPAGPASVGMTRADDEETVVMARSCSRSRVALPTQAALIIGAAEPAAVLQIGRGIVFHGLGGAYICADAPAALCGASDRRVADDDDSDGGRPSCLDGGCDMTGELKMGNIFLVDVLFLAHSHT